MQNHRTGRSVRARLSSARTHLFWLLTFLLITAIAAMGQERFGELNGVATDPSGAVLPNVAVTMTEVRTARVTTTKTDCSDSYAFGTLSRVPTRSALSCRASRSWKCRTLWCRPASSKVDAPLAVGTAEQSVQVTEAAPLIDTTTTAVATNISSEEFDRLPKVANLPIGRHSSADR